MATQSTHRSTDIRAKRWGIFSAQPNLTGAPTLSSASGFSGAETLRPGLGKHGILKRHMKRHRDSLLGVTKNDIRRLARRGGVKRISGAVYADIRTAVKERLTKIVRASAILAELGKRKTISAQDVVYALNQLGHTMYGFG